MAATYIELKAKELIVGAIKKKVLRFEGLVINRALNLNEKKIGGVWRERHQASQTLDAVPVDRSLGFDIQDELRILGGDYIDSLGLVQTYEEIPMPVTVIKVSIPRHIIKNKVLGAPGTVKQAVSVGDHSLEIDSYLYDNNGNPPWDDINNLVVALNSTTSIGLKSGYLQALGLDGYSFVVDREPNIEQLRGTVNAVRVRFTLLSDNIELYRIEQDA